MTKVSIRTSHIIESVDNVGSTNEETKSINTCDSKNRIFDCKLIYNNSTIKDLNTKISQEIIYELKLEVVLCKVKDRAQY